MCNNACDECLFSIDNNNIITEFAIELSINWFCAHNFKWNVNKIQTWKTFYGCKMLRCEWHAVEKCSYRTKCWGSHQLLAWYNLSSTKFHVFYVRDGWFLVMKCGKQRLKKREKTLISFSRNCFNRNKCSLSSFFIRTFLPSVLINQVLDNFRLMKWQTCVVVVVAFKPINFLSNGWRHHHPSSLFCCVQ